MPSGSPDPRSAILGFNACHELRHSGIHAFSASMRSSRRSTASPRPRTMDTRPTTSNVCLAQPRLRNACGSRSRSPGSRRINSTSRSRRTSWSFGGGSSRTRRGYSCTAARQFQRTFLLADGMEVLGADLSNGLLSIDLARPEPARVARRVEIVSRD